MKLTVAKKLYGGFGMTLGMLALLSVYLLWSMGSVNTNMETLYSKHLIGTAEILEANIALISSDRAEKNAILADNDAEAKKHADSAIKFLNTALKQVKLFEETVVLDSTREAVEDMKKELVEIRAGREHVLALALAHKDTEAHAAPAPNCTRSSRWSTRTSTSSWSSRSNSARPVTTTPRAPTRRRGTSPSCSASPPSPPASASPSGFPAASPPASTR